MERIQSSYGAGISGELITWHKNTSLFDNKIIHKFCYEVNGYTISVSRINTTIHMYLTVRSGTSPLGDVPGGLSQIRKRG